jgi:TonB family protein
VELRVTVAEDGTVRDIQVVSGLGVFTEAATSAVRRWRYTPALLDGKPVEMVREINLEFRPPPATR